MAATFSRRSLLSASTAALLSGCGQSNFAQVGSTINLAWGSSTPVYNPTQARQLPYATLDAKIGRAAPALLVLGEVEDNDYLHWFSHDRTQLITTNLRIVKTAGLPQNLGQTNWIAPEARHGMTFEDGQRTLRMIDLPESNRYGVLIESEVHKDSKEEIDIYGQKILTTIYIEISKSKSLDWSSESKYWQDEAGTVWQSTQTPIPYVPEFTLKILKPYSG
ncbi:YjbF family lipoprotein [Radicibacter daui]|uniref:YjbF family lipoprotein n=1 Tax=Radicibacter daui TaxID=3064829 RepID=UPI004046F117